VAAITEETVALVPVLNETELLRELSAIRAKLDGKMEWDMRITALRRLHGIAQGGAGAYPAFVEHLKGSLRDPLRTQMTDRRSQVCAAHGKRLCVRMFSPLVSNINSPFSAYCGLLA
jgi:hypothetical protein